MQICCKSHIKSWPPRSGTYLNAYFIGLLFDITQQVIFITLFMLSTNFGYYAISVTFSHFNVHILINIIFSVTLYFSIICITYYYLFLVVVINTNNMLSCHIFLYLNWNLP